MRLDQRGFALPSVLGMLVVAVALASVAYAAASGGRAASGQSRDGKQAYAAAESGLNWYLSRLVADNAYWAKCTAVRSAAAPVNDPWNGAGTDPRQWRALPDSTGAAPAEYAIELLPANGRAACDRKDPNATMIDMASRTFRIRSVGRYGTAKRAIVASFKRASFLDFVYLTEYETTDPLNYTPPDDGSGWTSEEYTRRCANQLRPARNANVQTTAKRCREIQFADADVIDGPLHSNDSLMTCGRPEFGRVGKSDLIETTAAAPGYVRASGCSSSATPIFRPKLQTSVSPILMPTTFKSISDAVRSQYRFTGRTRIRLDGTRIVVRNEATGVEQTLPWPDNGLVYVESGTSCTAGAPSRIAADSSSLTCGDAYVSGTYDASLTVAAANDVVVTGDVTQGTTSTDAVAGLIASRFVRIAHPVGNYRRDRDGRELCDSLTGTVRDATIESAILAVHHSFTVDNYACGGDLGTLTVKGGIAQNYRGAVGLGAQGRTNNSAAIPRSGYDKAYGYDDRFVYRNPPFFLEPAAAAWRVVRSGEQTGAR